LEKNDFPFLIYYFFLPMIVAKIVITTNESKKIVKGYTTQLTSGYKSCGLFIVSITVKGTLSPESTRSIPV
jgi:hypothetical protein